MATPPRRRSFLATQTAVAPTWQISVLVLHFHRPLTSTLRMPKMTNLEQKTWAGTLNPRRRSSSSSSSSNSSVWFETGKCEKPLNLWSRPSSLCVDVAAIKHQEVLSPPPKPQDAWVWGVAHWRDPETSQHASWQMGWRDFPGSLFFLKSWWIWFITSDLRCLLVLWHRFILLLHSLEESSLYYISCFPNGSSTNSCFRHEKSFQPSAPLVLVLVVLSCLFEAVESFPVFTSIWEHQ